MKLASKKGKTFADVAKPIQNLIEKLKDKPQSQAVKNSTMLLEKQLDDLFAQQEAMKPQPQTPQDMNQMVQNPQEEMMEGQQGQNPEEEQMEMVQPQMGYGGYLYKHFAGETVGNPNKPNNSFNAALDNRTSYRLPPEEPSMTDEQAQRFDYRRKQRFKELHPSYGTTVQNRPAGYVDPIVNQMGPMNKPDGYVDPNQAVQNNIGPVFGQENNSSMMNAQPTYNNNIFQPAVTGPGDIVRNQSNQQELSTALNKQTQEEQPTDMVTFGRKNSKINYDKPDFVAKKDAAKTATNTNPYNNWSELGALGSGIAGMYKQINANAKVQAPTDVQSAYLGNGIAPPKVDYSEEQNQINADAAADREAVRLGGGSFSTQAGNLGKIRAQQLQGRGKITTQQSRENAANMAAYNDRVANLGAESQKMNLAAAAENNANKVGFQQWQAAQDNAATANATQMTTNVFNNRTMYKNQLAQAQIMANAHPESVWADAQGNKFYTTPQGQKIPLSPQAEAPVVSATNPTGVNMVPAATPAVVAPITNPTAPAAKPKANSKVKTNINSKTATNFVPNGTFSNLPKGMKAFADGGSVYRQELYNKAIGPNVKTIDNAAAMDAEYQQNLNAGNKSFKSSITGLDYKVMPRSEKDLYAANMWKELHGTAPTKPQVAATKKAIEDKPTSSTKAKTVAEIINDKWTNQKPSWITPEMENLNKNRQQQEAEFLKEQKTVNTLKEWNPRAAAYYSKTGDLQGALDSYVAPDRFDVSSGSAGYSIGKAAASGDMQGVDYLNAGMLLAGAFGARKAGANPKLKQLNEKNPRVSNVRSTPEERTIQGTKNWKYQTEQTPGLQEYYDKKAKMFREVNPKVKYTDPLKQQGKLEPNKQKLLPGATKTSIDNEDEAFALDFNKRQNAIANDKMDKKLKIQEGADKFTKAGLKNMNKRLDNMEVDSYGTIKMGENTLNNLQKAELFKIKNLERQMRIAKKAGDTKKYNRLQSAYLNSMEID